jgi:hypothetical protein
MNMLVQDFVAEPDTFFLGIKSLNTKSVAAAKDAKARVIPVVAKHLCREISAEVCRSGGRIDPRRKALNFSLLPDLATAAKITERAVAVMEEHGILWKKKRKDQVMGVELVFSVPPGFKGDVRVFFAHCLRWVETHFPRPIQVIAAMAHRDEGRDHVHIVLVPILGHGQMSGHKVIGYKAVYNKRANSFHQEVAQRYGLRKPRCKGKLTYAERQQLADLILARMMVQGWSGSPAAIKSMRKLLSDDPVPMAQTMGLMEPTAYAVDGDDEAASAGDPTAYLCNAVDAGADAQGDVGDVGDVIDPADAADDGIGAGDLPPTLPLDPAPAAIIPAPIRIDIPAADPGPDADVDPPKRLTRVRDADLSADRWDGDQGEHVPLPPPSPSKRAQMLLGVQVVLGGRLRGRDARVPQAAALLDGKRPRAGGDAEHAARQQMLATA